MDAVIRFSLRHRALIVVAALIVLGVGSALALRMPIDVLPDLDRPRVVLLTECPGLAAEEVELLVSTPIELAVMGAAGVVDVRSQSVAGLSVVYIEFGWDQEIRAARQTVLERLTTLTAQLPPGVTPYMAPSSSILGQIVIAGVSRRPGPGGGVLAPLPNGLMAERVGERVRVWKPGDRRDHTTWTEAKDDAGGVRFPSEEEQQRSLRSLADWVIRPRLRKIPGVAEVLIQGGERKQYQVRVDPAALHEFGVTLRDVEDALKDNNVNASGGFAVEGDTERPVRLIGRLGPDPEAVLRQVRRIPVKAAAKRTVLVDQVAQVVEGSALKRGDGAVDGRPAVVLTIAKQPHVDTRALTDEITAALRDVEAGLPADVVIDPGLFQLKRFIDRGIYNVGEALVIGAVLVLIVLFLFLMNVRTTFITLTAIPLSLAVTVIVFRLVEALSGVKLSVNVMTLGGIAVAMGELVDDAIVDVENIYRRLNENAASAAPRPMLSVVYEASREVRSAIVFGTAVVILVFLPLFALSGVEGRLFAPLGVAYITSILASLVVSLTVTPALSSYLLAARAGHHAPDGWLVRGLKWAAGFLVRFSLRHAILLLLLTWIGVAGAAFLMTRLGADFLPPFDEGSVQVNVTLPAGSSLEASSAAARIVDAKLKRMQADGVLLSFVRRTGRAELDEHAMPVSGSEYLLSVNPAGSMNREQLIEALSEGLKGEVPGADLEVEQPLAHLISHMLSGVTAQVAIKVYGDDLTALRAAAERVKAAAAGVPGVTPPVIEAVRSAEEIHIRLREDDLAQHGLSRGYVAEFVQAALLGEPVGQVLEGQRRFDLVVRLADDARTDLAALRMPLPNGRGWVKLADVADVGDDAGPSAINRDNGRRRIVVRLNARGRDLASVVADVRRRVDERVKLPEGYFLEYGGQFESQQRATAVIGGLALVALGGMFVVLMMLYPSVRVTLQILNALPTAFIGGVLALALTGQSLTVASLVGFISLGGIAVRNGILLVTHYFHLMKEEGEGFTEAMVVRGSLERLAPVLMTALTAGIGLVPLVWAGNEPGREILYPVATVILGGLVTSTFCEFLIHPGLFWRFSGRDAQRLAGRTNEEELS